MQNKTCGYSPTLGLDWVSLTAKGFQLNFHKVGPEAGPNKSVSLCVSRVTWKSIVPPVQDPIPCCHSPPPLCCFHLAETLPCGVCALLPAHQHDRKDVTAAHGYSSNISNVTVNFMALFLLEDLVRMQLLYNSYKY